MLERARRLSRDQGLSNVTYEQADAQVHRFPPARFDVCISRFGTMFFADPVAAFDNVTRLWDENRLAGLDAATVERARTRLRAALDAHSTDSGVYFDSRAWIVEARRHS